jgi:hypothetical protein
MAGGQTNDARVRLRLPVMLAAAGLLAASLLLPESARAAGAAPMGQGSIEALRPVLGG